MGRRCKKCERPQICKTAVFCPSCEVEAVEPTDETDAEFAKLFEEYHKENATGNTFDGDIFKHKERLDKLESTTEIKAELEQLRSIQNIIEVKKELLKNKLLASAISADMNKKLSPPKVHQVSPVASPIAELPSVKCVVKCPPPLKRKPSLMEIFDQNANVIEEAPLSSSPLPALQKVPAEIKKDVMDLVENVTDEIDGNCIFNEVAREDENEEDLEPTSTRKVVRRRSSVKDRIKAFEMLSKRFTL